MAIIAAIVLQGVLGVLIIVPLLATFVVLGRYIRRRLLGLPPFEDEEPPPLVPQPASTLEAESTPKRMPARKKAVK